MSRRLAPVLLCVLACQSGSQVEETGSTGGTGSEATTAVNTGETGETSVTGVTSVASVASTPTTGAGCPAPLADCDGACVDLEHDPGHCGDCGVVCGDGLTCVEGVCGVVCGVGGTVCGEQCVDPNSDPAHCGGCDHACADGVACVVGACVPECGADETVCGEECVALARDEANCGGCDLACAADQPCVFGRCVDTAVHHLLIGGQSLSVGYGSQVVSVEQPFENVMFNTGVRAGADGLTGFIPLVETADGGLGETIASGLANHVAGQARMLGGQHTILASAHGVSGQPYSVLKKGTASFAAGMAQVAAGTTIAATQGETHALRAVAIIHGESDHVANNLGYANDLLAWQADYETDATAITGQVHPVVMFLCQMSSFTAYNAATSPIPRAQLEAARARPDRIFVVGPKYFLPYVDGVHLSGDGERWLGEFYAKAYRRVLLDGMRWRPLAPAIITREGAVITIGFEVPAPPLVFDELAVSNPGNFGFEFSDSSGAPPAITEVMLLDATTVRVTLASPPAAANRRIRYAYTGVPGQPGGPMTGARGNLRDSDPTPSLHGYPLANWAVHFDEPVP